MCPAYGLAESSVALTLGAMRRAPRVDLIAREPFERTRADHTGISRDARALRFVSCGRALPDHEVRIVDAAASIGRRAHRGPDPFSWPLGDTRVLSQRRAPPVPPCTTAGWTLAISATRLRATSSSRAARRISSSRAAETSVRRRSRRSPPVCPASDRIASPHLGSPTRAPGLNASSSSRRRENRDPARREALRRAVRDRLVTGVGSPPDVVVIADPRTVLKTSSGKIRRSAIRDAYLKGTLGARRSVAGQRARLLLGDLAQPDKQVRRLAGPRDLHGLDFARLTDLAAGLLDLSGRSVARPPCGPGCETMVALHAHAVRLRPRVIGSRQSERGGLGHVGGQSCQLYRFDRPSGRCTCGISLRSKTGADGVPAHRHGDSEGAIHHDRESRD